MIKAIELIVVVTLMIFSFVVGVKYSDSVKSHAGWLFETKEEEVDLPDLTNESAPESTTVYDNGAAENGDQMPPENENSAPANAAVEAPAQPVAADKAPAAPANAVPAAKAPVAKQ